MQERVLATFRGEVVRVVACRLKGTSLEIDLGSAATEASSLLHDDVAVLSVDDWNHVLGVVKSLKEESAPLEEVKAERDHFQAQAREFEKRAVDAEEQVGELEGKLEDAEGERDELRVFIAALQAQVKDLKERMEHRAPPRCGCDAAYLGMAIREIDSLLTDIYGIHKIDENDQPMSLADRIIWLASKAGFKDPFPRAAKAKEGGGP